jgi:hypothetical protein
MFEQVPVQTKIESIDKELYYFLPNPKLLEIWDGDPSSGIQRKAIPDSGCRVQNSTGYGTLH